MIFKFLRKIGASSEAHPIHSPLDEQHHAHRDTVTQPSYPTILNVPEGQNAVLYQPSNGARLYHSGIHTLDKQDIRSDEKLDIIYLRPQGECNGQWMHHYNDHERVQLALSGDYSLQIEHPQRLAQVCIGDTQFTDDQDFGQWLANSIAHILKSQRIPARDINAENERFAGFLREALTHALRPRGLALKQLSLDITPIGATQTQQSEPQLTLSAMEPDDDTDAGGIEEERIATTTSDDQDKQNSSPTPQQSISTVATPAPTAHIVIAQNKRPKKLYYCVRNGQQLGPYSQADIQNKIDKGELRKRDLLWQKGLPSWKNISDFKEFNWPE